MLSVADLVRALSTFRPPPDAQQHQAVNAAANAGLFIVAGPGTGKTASITLRILKLALVDGLPRRGQLVMSSSLRDIALPVQVASYDEIRGHHGG